MLHVGGDSDATWHAENLAARLAHRIHRLVERGLDSVGGNDRCTLASKETRGDTAHTARRPGHEDDLP